MAIQRLAIQSQQCTTCIHKTTETSSSNLEEARHTGHTVPQRYDSSGEEQGGREETSSYSTRVAGSLGVHCQHREEHYQPSSKAEIPGVLFELPDDDHLPSRRQDAVDKESSEKVEKLRPDVCERAGMPMVTAHPAILPAPLHYSNLERVKSTALSQGHPYDQILFINKTGGTHSAHLSNLEWKYGTGA